jgi:hypothetical protein
MELFNHWYWSRAEIGPYNNCFEMIAEKKFNNESTIVLTSQKTEITDNGEYVTYIELLVKCIQH